MRIFENAGINVPCSDQLTYSKKLAGQLKETVFYLNFCGKPVLRFMYALKSNELLLCSDFNIHHALMLDLCKGTARYDDYVMGWLGASREYPYGILHFHAGNYSNRFEELYQCLLLFLKLGANSETVIRGISPVWERPLKNIIPEKLF